MYFVFGGNGFFGYFFSESSMSAAITSLSQDPLDWSTYEVEECPDLETLAMVDVICQLREKCCLKETCWQRLFNFFMLKACIQYGLYLFQRGSKMALYSLEMQHMRFLQAPVNFLLKHWRMVKLLYCSWLITFV